MMKTPLKNSSKICCVLKIAKTVYERKIVCLLPALPDIKFWWSFGNSNFLSVIALPMSLLYHQFHIICVSQEHKTIVKCYGNAATG